MEHSEKIWHLFAKSLNREISPDEQQELDLLLSADPVLAQQYDLLSRMWIEHAEAGPDDLTTSGTISRIISRAQDGESAMAPIRHRPPRRIRRLLWPLAAVMVVVAGSLWFFMRPAVVAGAASTESRQELVTQKGSRSRFLLPDGTVVWLNSGSRLTLENDFTGKTREVKLDGEGYFNVSKNKERPFIVHTSGISIRVLGTVFNVKAYEEDENIETTLLNGSVQVFRENDSEQHAVRLEKNQKLVMRRAVDGGGAEIAKGHSSPVGRTGFAIIPIDSTHEAKERFETAWMYSRLEFRGDDFEKLAHKLERWYNIKIVFSDDEVKKLNFNGSFERETVEQAFMALQAALPKFSYVMKNQEVTIGSKP